MQGKRHAAHRGRGMGVRQKRAVRLCRHFLDDFQTEGEIERAGRFQFMRYFVEAFLVVDIESEFPDVKPDADFTAPVGFVLVNVSQLL